MEQNHVRCSDCGFQTGLYPGVVMLQQYESEILRRISANGCALLGMGGRYANDVYCNIEGFRDAEGLILLDKNPMVQKNGFHGKTVISSERLPELGVNKVYCCTENPNTYAIKKELEGTSIKAVGLFEILLEE